MGCALEPSDVPMGIPVQEDVPLTTGTLVHQGSHLSSDNMERELSSGRATWSKSWSADMLFYLSNNDVLLSAFLAHPAHPFSRTRRTLTLFTSLAFAFWLTAIFNLLIPIELARTFVRLTLGTLLQLVYDFQVATLGSCVCSSLSGSSSSIGRSVAHLCQFFSFMWLTCHTCLGLCYALIGLLLLALQRDPHAVILDFVRSKMLAFAAAIPTGILSYALRRECERGARLPILEVPPWPVRRARAAHCSVCPAWVPHPASACDLCERGPPPI